jgi:hypothetical protein
MISASAELLAQAILLQSQFERPLGAVIAKLRPKPPGQFSIGPTEALLLARLLGCVARGLRVRQRRTRKMEAGAVRSPGVNEAP